MWETKRTAAKNGLARGLARVPTSAFVALGALAWFGLHLCFPVAGFGEVDQARDARDSITWHARGEVALDDFSYRLRTSPLYLRALKYLLDHGLRIARLPSVMNGFSTVMGSLCLVGLFYLCQRLSSARVAAVATLIYAFTPGFWLCSSYGMPTIPACACLILGALSFARALESRGKFAAPGLLLLALVSCWFAFTLKADLALSSGVFVAVILRRSLTAPNRKRAVIELGLAGVIVAAATGLTIAFSRVVTAGMPVAEPVASTGEFLGRWHQQFPFQLSLLFESKNNAPLTHAIGSLWFGVSLLALLHGLVRDREARARVLGVAIWALPSIVFWGITPGNSARHNVAAMAPLAFAATAFLFDIAGEKSRPYLLVAAVMACSYLDTSGDGTVVPSFNIVRGSRRLQRSSDDLHSVVRDFMHQPAPKKAVVDSDFFNPYSTFEAWAAATKPTLSETSGYDDGPDRSTRILRTNSPTAARRFAAQMRAEGRVVCSLAYHFCDVPDR